MDMPGWDSVRPTPNIPAKRTWDGDSSPSSLSAGPRPGESQPPAHFRHLSGPKHSTKRTSDTSNQHLGWDTSPQTQGWPIKPDPIRHGTGLDERYGAERRQPQDSRDAPLNTPDHNTTPFSSQSSWTKYRRESSGSSFQTSFDLHCPPSSNGKMRYYSFELPVLIG